MTIFKTQVGTQVWTDDLTGRESIWDLMESERMKTYEHIQSFEEYEGQNIVIQTWAMALTIMSLSAYFNQPRLNFFLCKMGPRSK